MTPARSPFLSPTWIEAVRQLRADTPPPENLPAVVVNLVINGAPADVATDGTVEAYLDTVSGTPEVELGQRKVADVTVTTDYETAKALLVDLDPAAAMSAFMTGKVVIQGELLKLMALNAMLASDPRGLDAAADIRAVTA